MNVNELIKDNNKKRKILTKENLLYYEDMLVYIRLSFNKSEKETEDILSELLDHLLQAQQDGKTAEDVFGTNPKQYANDIIGELPKIVTKERTLLFTMGVLYFLASILLFTGFFDLIMYYIFSKGKLTAAYHIGSVFLKVILFLPIAFSLLYLIVFYLRWSCFKTINKVLDFFILWMYGIFSIGPFFLVIYFIPSFGPVIHIPVYVLLVAGIILFVGGRLTSRR